MSISGDDLINFAGSCYLSDNEIELRNSISRGYYGMYHKVKSILEHYHESAQSDHSNLIAYLENKARHKNEPYDTTDLKKLSYILSQEKLSRVAADYHIHENVSKDDAQLSNATRVRFCELLLSLKSNKK